MERKSKLQMIAVDKLHPHPQNPRKVIGDVTELAESIKANGILQNLTVVPNNDNWDDKSDFTVVIGHRRLAAAKQAGLTELPCAVVEMTEKEQLSLNDSSSSSQSFTLRLILLSEKPVFSATSATVSPRSSNS